MARPRSGIGFKQRGVVYTGVRLPDGRRWVRPVAIIAPPPPGVELGVAWARAVGLQLQARFDRGEWSPEQVRSIVVSNPVLPATPAAAARSATTIRAIDRPARKAAASATAPTRAIEPPGETVRAWFERWLNDRAQKGLSTVRTDRSRFRSHVEPVLGDKSIATVSKADIEALVSALDDATRAGQSWRTSWNGWALTRAMFRDASRSKTVTLRVRSDNPCDGVAAPDRGTKKVKQYISPAEFLSLVRSERVPERFRVLYTLAVYLYARPGELEALAWEDLDLERGTVHIHRAVHYDTGAVKPVKTREARRFSIEANLLPLLRALAHGKKPDERVVPEGVPKNSAELLREHLRLAGITRSDLFASDATRKPMTFYDLRATGITWRAIRGDEPLRIQRAAGHTGFDTTQGYIREAESVRDGVGEVFPSLLATSFRDGLAAAPDPLLLTRGREETNRKCS